MLPTAADVVACFRCGHPRGPDEYAYRVWDADRTHSYLCAGCAISVTRANFPILYLWEPLRPGQPHTTVECCSCRRLLPADQCELVRLCKYVRPACRECILDAAGVRFSPHRHWPVPIEPLEPAAKPPDRPLPA